MQAGISKWPFKKVKKAHAEVLMRGVTLQEKLAFNEQLFTFFK